MLVLCDFDGTITSHDVTNLLWDRYGLPEWRDRLLPPYRAGLKTTLDLMDAGWRVIARPEQELLAVVRGQTGLRPGFVELVERARVRNWQLHVVSCGLDWYLRGFLPDGVPFTSYAASLEDGWRVRLPDGCELPSGTDFKVHVLDTLRAGQPAMPTVFIGDGQNDLPIARACDKVFAVRGSTLATLARREGLPVEEFETFHSVLSSLEVSGIGKPDSSF